MAIMGAIEAREPAMVGRSREIALHAVAAARALLLSAELIDGVRLAALLSNVGMMQVPEAILQKTGDLTAQDIATIRTHPVLGAELLALVPNLRHILPLILHHHENWQGDGYPYGLAGEAIPLGARIIRVAETYDALTSARPHRAALSPDEALRMLARGAGKEFDPRVVEGFAFIMGRDTPPRDELLDRWETMQRQARTWQLVAKLRAA